MNKRKLTIILILILSLAIIAGALYFLNQKFHFLADLAMTSVVSNDGLRQNYNTDKDDFSVSIDGTTFSTGMAAAKSQGAYIKDVIGDKQYSPSDFTSHNVSIKTGEIVENGNIADLNLNSKVTSKANRLDYDLTLAKTSSEDTPINMCYSIPVEADGWTWHDDIYNSRVITGDTVYGNLVTKDVNTAGYHFEYLNQLSMYPLGTIVSPDKSIGLAFSVPPDKPRTFYIQYDNSLKRYSICYDFVLSQKTVNFNNSVDVSFSLYKINQPSYGFRSALEKYYDIYPEAFTNKAEAGSFFYTTSTDMTKYNLADYAFKYNYAFGINTTLRDTTTASGGKSGIYVWPDGYFFGRDISYFKTTETCPVSDSYRNFTENLLTKILNNSITPKYTCTEVPKYQTGEQYYANSHCTLNTSFSEAGCLDGKKVYFGKQVTRNLLDLDPKIATCNARLQSSAILDRNGDPYVVPLACTSGYCYSDATNGYSVSETPYQVGMNPSPTLSQPAGSSDDGVCKGVENWGMENINNSIRVVSQYQYDGVAIDTYGSYGQQDFDLNHFTNVRVPLTYDKQTNRPIVYQPFSLYEYMNDLRRDLPADKMIYANGLGQSGSGFLQKNVDVFMGERKSNLINAGFDATGIIDPYLLRLRSLMSEKSHTVVISDYTSAEAMSKVNYLAFFGDFTYLSKDTDGKYFFTTASPTELQTAEYKATQQAVKKISEAGWEPVTYAQSGDPEVKIERFGGKNDGNIYLSVRNFSNIEKETKIVLDTKMLDISSVIDYVKVLGDSLVVKADNGFTIKTAPLQTYVLEVKYSDIALSSIGSINLTEGQVITTNPYIISVVAKDAAETLRISKVEFYIDDTLISTSTLPDVSGSYQAVWDTSKYHSTVKIIVYGTDGTTQELTRNTTVNLSGAQENNDIVVVLPKTGEEKWKDKAVSDIRSLWNKVFH